MERQPRGAGLALAASVALLVATVAVLGGAGSVCLQRTFDDTWLVDLLLLSTVTLSATVTGLLIALRRPGNQIGLLLSLHGFLVALVFDTDPYATYAGLEHPGRLPGAGWAELISSNYWPLLFVTSRPSFTAFRTAGRSHAGGAVTS